MNIMVYTIKSFSQVTESACCFHSLRAVKIFFIVTPAFSVVLSFLKPPFSGIKTLFTEACNTGSTQTQPHQISNTQRTENKTTDVVIQQHSRKLLMMDILMSETC